MVLSLSVIFSSSALSGALLAPGDVLRAISSLPGDPSDQRHHDIQVCIAWPSTAGRFSQEKRNKKGKDPQKSFVIEEKNGLWRTTCWEGQYGHQRRPWPGMCDTSGTVNPALGSERPLLGAFGDTGTAPSASKWCRIGQQKILLAALCNCRHLPVWNFFLQYPRIKLPVCRRKSHVSISDRIYHHKRKERVEIRLLAFGQRRPALRRCKPFEIAV